MTAMQAMGLGGGWPLNVFLTPGARAVLRRHVLPARRSARPRRHARAAAARARGVDRASATRIDDTGAQLLARARREHGRAEDAAQALETASAVRRALRRARAQSHDPEHGGFGARAEVPVRREPRRSCAAAARVDATPRARTHALGHGAAPARRDARGRHPRPPGRRLPPLLRPTRAWLVPHFEKMLYDQAQLASAYLDALPGSPAAASYAGAARGIFDYVARDLTVARRRVLLGRGRRQRGRGGALLRLDARPRSRPLLGAADAALFATRYGVTRGRQLRARHQRPARGALARGTARAHAGSPRTRPRARLDARRARSCSRRARSASRPHARRQGARGVERAHDLGVRARRARARATRRSRRAPRAPPSSCGTRLRDPATRRARAAAGATARRRGAGQLDDHAYLALGLLDLYAGHARSARGSSARSR